MSKYPNLEALADGRIRGDFRNWHPLRRETKELLADVWRLREELLRGPDFDNDTLNYYIDAFNVHSGNKTK